MACVPWRVLEDGGKGVHTQTDASVSCGLLGKYHQGTVRAQENRSLLINWGITEQVWGTSFLQNGIRGLLVLLVGRQE